MKLCKVSNMLMTHQPQQQQQQQETEIDEEYYNSLQRYSTLYRILLAKPYATEMKLGHWNRVDLKLVNELGLTLTSVQKINCWLEVNVRLLVKEGHQFKACKDYKITCRPIQHDEWEYNTNSDMAGFYNNTEGDFEYMISIGDEAVVPFDNNYYKALQRQPNNHNHNHSNGHFDTPNKYYIQIFPTCKPQQVFQAFPLVIGPITIKYNNNNQVQYKQKQQHNSTTLHSKKMKNSHSNGTSSRKNGHTSDGTSKSMSNGSNGYSLEWNDNDKVSQDIFHAYCIKDSFFLIIKENWELGTPGKMWDSALVLSQMFSDKIKSNPTRFKGHRILDLSAGTGCVGLLLGSLYKNVYNQDKGNLPHITMTDLPEALDLIHQNCASNHLEDYINIHALTWGSYEDAQRILVDGPIHTIIASDVLYEPASFSKLVQTLDWLSAGAPNSTIDIFLGYKRRGLSREDEQSFFDICAEKFDISILPIHVENKLITDEGWIVGGGFSNIFKETGVNIYQLARKYRHHHYHSI